MRYIKLFEEFSNYTPTVTTKPKMGMSVLSAKRSKGSINWFTRDEIQKIRSRAKELGVPRIMEKARGINQSFFGDSRGIGGLKESVINFFKYGGDLCKEVSILTKEGDYQIIKRGGEFTLNGRGVGNNIDNALNMMR